MSLPRATSAFLRRDAAAFSVAAARTQRRFYEYWAFGVTARTQPYAQGDRLPLLDNRNGVKGATGAAAGLTGNPTLPVYDSNNIFSEAAACELESKHYESMRGITRYKIDPIDAKEGVAAAALIVALLERDVENSLSFLWWEPLLRDFPSLKKPATPDFRTEWQDFYVSALRVASDETAVRDLAAPFGRRQNQQHYIGYAMFWRIAEKLADCLERAPRASKYEKRAARTGVERVTKILLNTLADEPWACEMSTSPLHVDVSNFRPWHEAGNW